MREIVEHHPPLPPVIGPRERMRVTVLFSLLLHAVVVLGITFTYADPASTLPSLDVILVEARSEDNPDKPDFLANASQRGGGEHDESKRPTQPTSSPVPKPQPGIAPREVRAQAPKPAPKSPVPVLQTEQSPTQVQQTQDQQEVPDVTALSGRELVERSLEMARLAAEIDRQSEAYAKRPKRKFISANTQEYEYASYMRGWVARVERIGNLNYPDEARRQRVAGDLVLTVAVRRDGSVERIDLIQSSGYPLLDEAAQRIVQLSAPFAPLPRSRDNVDILHITRTWQFTAGGTLGTR